MRDKEIRNLKLELYKTVDKLYSAKEEDYNNEKLV